MPSAAVFFFSGGSRSPIVVGVAVRRDDGTRCTALPGNRTQSTEGIGRSGANDAAAGVRHHPRQAGDDLAPIVRGAAATEAQSSSKLLAAFSPQIPRKIKDCRLCCCKLIPDTPQSSPQSQSKDSRFSQLSCAKNAAKSSTGNCVAANLFNSGTVQNNFSK